MAARRIIIALLLSLGVGALLCAGTAAAQTAQRRDDPIVAYGAATREILHLGGCAAVYSSRGDKAAERLFERVGRTGGGDPDIVLVLHKFPAIFAQDVQAFGKPDPSGVAARTVQVIRAGAEQELAQEGIRDEAGFARGCDEIRASLARGEPPFVPLHVQFPKTISRFRTAP
jgi:hypothetical protein